MSKVECEIPEAAARGVRFRHSHRMETLMAEIPAAQYLRMSTDQQKLSLAYQAATIQRYADTRGFKIVQSYEDRGRSGLTLKHRVGLAQLLQDVVGGEQEFKANLVYDVSRWGRFQDTDESAHYEFLCKSAGVPVHYCAESFRNNSSSPAVIMKTLKRVMAAEYSWELSQRLSRTKKILTQRGFRAGGMAGYGLRRMLLSGDGSRKRLLAHGEIKDTATGRVILVPGPAKEVARVREIYSLKILGGKSASSIARDLNRKDIKCCGEPWTGARVLEILTNPKYVGCAAWGRTTGPLGRARVSVPQHQWIVNAAAFEPVVDRETFDTAQRVLSDRTCNKSNDELLDGLRRLLKCQGRLGQHLIDMTPGIPTSATYFHRFGSLRRAYALVGYQEVRNQKGMLQMRARHERIKQALLRSISRMLRDEVQIVRERNVSRQMLCFKGGHKVSLLICQCIDIGEGDFRWAVPVNPYERDNLTLLCRCAPNNRSVKDFYLLPSIDTTCSDRFRIKERDPWLENGVRLSDLSKLRIVADKLFAARSCMAEQQRHRLSPGNIRHRPSRTGADYLRDEAREPARSKLRGAHLRPYSRGRRLRSPSRIGTSFTIRKSCPHC
jgi:DNA invertase Pin-like site-specific DNA recombinase